MASSCHDHKRQGAALVRQDHGELQRYYRDISVYHGHISVQYLSTATEMARVHFGLPDSLF